MSPSSPRSSRYNSKYSSDRNRDRSQSPNGPRRSSQRYSSRDETKNRPRNTEATTQSPKNDEEPEVEHKPNFERSGLLAAETNVYNGVIVKYNEPSDAAKPNIKWRWYVFKGEKELEMLPLYRQSAYLIGRDRKVADIPIDHASCSKQHAALQYRKVTERDSEGRLRVVIKPYIIDLESANGTKVNGVQIPPVRYVELKHKDVIKFGASTREYVYLKED